MLLDHFNSFADFQPVGLLLDFPILPSEPVVEVPQRKRTGGFFPETIVETERGFIQARDVKPGDMVYTFDGGAQEVKAVRHAVPRMTTMIHVPALALGNETDLCLPADQIVALEIAAIERLFGLPLAMVKLISLVGYKGIKAIAPERMGRIHIECEEEELIWAEGGMLMQSGENEDGSAFKELSVAETRQVLASEEGRALAATGIEGEDARFPNLLQDLLDSAKAA